MPDPEQPPIVDTQACGYCGAKVDATDVTCSACGVLLAAYRPPAGSLSRDEVFTTFPQGAASATREAPPSMSSGTQESASDSDREKPVFSTPAFSTPAFNAAPVHKPASQSPIGDALRQSAADSAYWVDDRAPVRKGADELSRMADGNDELADMADGSDELSAMAASGGSSLAREVEAELAGARVTFEGARPMIESSGVEIVPTTGAGPPNVAGKADRQSAARPNRQSPLASDRTRAMRPQNTGTPDVYDEAVISTVSPSRVQAAPPGATRKGRTLGPSTVARWLPFILIGLVVFGFGRLLPGMGGVIGFVLVVVVIYVLLKWTAASGRKTSSMPRDDSWNRKKRR